MSYQFEETYAVYDERERTARKAHVCDACAEGIRPGDRYTHVSIVDRGSAHSVKRCARCQRIHEHLRDRCSDVGEMWPDEQLDCGLDYRREWGDDPPPEIAALAFALPGEVAE